MLPDGSVWTIDVLIEGVHFDDRLAPEDVGYKTVAVSVSDVAAMGARPTWMLLGVSVPADDDHLARFREGVRLACRHFGVALIGGDTTRSAGQRVFTSVVGGRCVAEPLLRSGGQVGDDLWVGRELGAAGAGWSRPSPAEHHLQALRRPRPQIELGLTLAGRGLATAAMDLSDGLATDLERLARASGTGATVHADLLPLAPGVDLREAVRGGEDYALLFTASPAHRDEILALGCIRIGSLSAAPAVRLLPGPWPPPLFDHFEGSP